MIHKFEKPGKCKNDFQNSVFCTGSSIWLNDHQWKLQITDRKRKILIEEKVSAFPKAWYQIKQETLCVVTITMICSTLAWLWKSQYFWRPIYNPVEHLWWSFYCENGKPLSILRKNSIVDARLGSKHVSAFCRLFKRFLSLKNFTL